jgi:predicted  nucleic acid-binding Zn-ribbon protein
MNVFNELREIGEKQEDMKSTADKILDLYHKYPKECEYLLNELNDISKELDELEKEFEKIQNEIS